MRGLKFFRLGRLGGRIGSRCGRGRAIEFAGGCSDSPKAGSAVGYGHRSASRAGASCIKRQSMYSVQGSQAWFAAFRMQLLVCRVWE